MTTSEAEHTSTGWVADDSTFGARLALVRQRMGWGNVKEAALACDIPPQSWRSWERDNVKPRDVVDRAWQIAERTGCDYEWLLHGHRTRERQPGSPMAPRVLARGGGGARRRRHRGESGELSSYSAIPTERTGCVAPPRPTSTNRPMPATAVTTPDRPPGHGPTPIAPRQRRTARLNPA